MSTPGSPDDATPDVRHDPTDPTDPTDDTAVHSREDWTMATDTSAGTSTGTSTDTSYWQPDPAPRGGRHPINLTHLIMGIVLATFAGIWVAIEVGSLPVDDLRWVLPLPWLLAGSAGLLAATLGRRRGERVSRRDGDVGVVGDHPVDPRP